MTIEQGSQGAETDAVRLQSKRCAFLNLFAAAVKVNKQIA